jgi:hypothetical protein
MSTTKQVDQAVLGDGSGAERGGPVERFALRFQESLQPCQRRLVKLFSGGQTRCGHAADFRRSLFVRRASETEVREAMLEEMIGQKVVIDLRSPFVCLGTLVRLDDRYLEVRNADFHDLRDAQSSRENYVAASLATGVKRNRKLVLLDRSDLIAISRQEDVVDE